MNEQQLHTLFDMTGKVAIVTGGHAWLGNDIACALAEYGCDIVITSRELARAQEAARKIGETYGVRTLGLELEQKVYASVE